MAFRSFFQLVVALAVDESPAAAAIPLVRGFTALLPLTIFSIMKYTPIIHTQLNANMQNPNVLTASMLVDVLPPLDVVFLFCVKFIMNPVNIVKNIDATIAMSRGNNFDLSSIAIVT
jgi:hypothetical protein